MGTVDAVLGGIKKQARFKARERTKISMFTDSMFVLPDSDVQSGGSQAIWAVAAWHRKME